MKSFGLTMAFAIMVSLIVSFTLTPMLSARFLKIAKKKDGDGVVEGLARVPRGRPVLHADARVGDEPPVGRGRGGRARPVLERAAVHGRQQELPAERRPVRVRDQPAGARRHEPRVHRGHHEPDHERDPERNAGGDVHAGADRRRRPEDAQPVDDLRPADADRRAAPRPVRGHGRHPEPHPAAAHGGTADLGAAGRQHRRRRQPERRHPVHHQRPRPGEARHVQQAAGGAGPPDEGRRRRGHVAQRGQTGSVGARRSAEGRRPRRADCRRRRGPAPPGGRRPGDDLQRRRRAVRGAPAREGRGPQHAGGRRPR